MDIKDAEQRKSVGPHVRLSSTVKIDGHGRVVETIARSHTGDAITRAEYLGTGEPSKIWRSGTPAYERRMQWDTLGHLVSNEEPNTSRTEGSVVRSWKYLYDGEGRLVATSDARGCGKRPTTTP